MLAGLLRGSSASVPLAVAPVLALIVLCMAISMVSRDVGRSGGGMTAAPPLLLFDSVSAPLSSSPKLRPDDLFTELIVRQTWQPAGEQLLVLDAQMGSRYRIDSRVYLIRSKAYVVTDLDAERDVAKAVLRRGCWGIICPPWRRDAFLDTWDIVVSPVEGLRHGFVMRQYYGDEWFGAGHWEVSTRLPNGDVGDVQMVVPRAPVSHSMLFCVPDGQAPGSGSTASSRCPHRLGLMVAAWEDGMYVWKLRLYVTGDHTAVPMPLALAVLSVVNRQFNAKFVVRSRFASDALGVPHAAGSLADPSMDRRLTPHQLMGLGAPLSSRRSDVLRDMTSAPDAIAANRYGVDPDDPHNTPVSFTSPVLPVRARQQSLRPG